MSPLLAPRLPCEPATKQPEAICLLPGKGRVIRPVVNDAGAAVWAD